MKAVSELYDSATGLARLEGGRVEEIEFLVGAAEVVTHTGQMETKAMRTPIFARREIRGSCMRKTQAGVFSTPQSNRKVRHFLREVAYRPIVEF